MMSRNAQMRRNLQVQRYRSNVRVYRLIERRNASLMIGKAVRRDYFYDPHTNHGAW